MKKNTATNLLLYKFKVAQVAAHITQFICFIFKIKNKTRKLKKAIRTHSSPVIFQ